MTKNEIETTGTSFDVIAAITNDAITNLTFHTLAALATLDRLSNLYSSVHPTNVWNENDDVREARRISSDVEFIKNKLISEVEFIKNELINIKISIHEINAYY